jgi:cytidylate kinase
VASGAQVIDTTHRTIDEVIQTIVAQVISCAP